MRVFAHSVVVILASALSLSAADNLTAKEQKSKSDVSRERAGQQQALHFNIEQFIKDYDRNNDGFLQRNEVPGYLRDRFDQLDTNKDGKLSRDELAKGIAYLQPPRRPSDFIVVLIEMSDCEDDCGGEIQRVYDILRKVDKNRNGKIEPEELSAARREWIDTRVNNIIKDLDRNGDGKISKDEARGQLRRDFDDLDTNKDGFVDRGELLQAAQEKPQSLQEKAAPQPRSQKSQNKHNGPK